MNKIKGRRILVVNDIEATREGIEALLKRDGYDIETARDEQNATNAARSKHPDLLLITLGDETTDVLAAVRRISCGAELDEQMPVIIFCAEEPAGGREIAVERNIYLSCPDNFNQLRDFIKRLVLKFQKTRQN